MITCCLPKLIGGGAPGTSWATQAPCVSQLGLDRHQALCSLGTVRKCVSPGMGLYLILGYKQRLCPKTLASRIAQPWVLPALHWVLRHCPLTPCCLLKVGEGWKRKISSRLITPWSHSPWALYIPGCVLQAHIAKLIRMCLSTGAHLLPSKIPNLWAVARCRP